MQQTAHDPLRRVAVLVSTLDTSSADRLLDELPAEDAARVRHLVVALSHVDADEEQAVIDAFLRTGVGRALISSPDATDPSDAGVELYLSDSASSTECDTEEVDAPSDAASPAAAYSEPSFDFLHDAGCDRLLQVLSAERPQTIALVLSRLPEARALQVIGGLPAALQSDVLRRWIDLDEADPTVLREVEQELQARIADCFGAYRRRASGFEQVAGVVQAADAPLKQQILANLSRVDAALAQQIADPRLDFADLEYFDDAALESLLPAVEAQTLVFALAGAAEPFVERVLQLMPSAQAKTIERGMISLGPVRLADIEAAQRELARIAARVVDCRAMHVASPPLAAAD